MALRRRWRRRWRWRVEVEASASKPHSKISAAGRRLGVGHRLTASLGYFVLRLQVRQRQRGAPTAAGRRQRTSGWKRWVRHRGGGARRDAGGSTRWPRRPARSAARAPSAWRGVCARSELGARRDGGPIVGV